MNTVSAIALWRVEEALASALGREGFSTASDVLDRYGAEGSGPAVAAAPIGRPAVVVWPATEDDVAAVVAIAHQHRVPVIPWGGGTGPRAGAPAVRGGIVVDLRSLSEVLEIDEVSMTATAQAGANVGDLEDRLSRRGLMLPDDTASLRQATVGGYIAAGGPGLFSTRYGRLDELVLSVRVATPANGLLELTTAAPRRGPGPAIAALFVGSEGVLGVITSATVAVVRRPGVRRFAAVRFPSVGAGVEAIRVTLQAGLRPSVVQLYDEGALRFAGGGAGVACALLGFEGEPEATVHEERGVLAIARAAGGELLDPALAEQWWASRRDFEHPWQEESTASCGAFEAAATYAKLVGVYDALHAAIRAPFGGAGVDLRMQLSGWSTWGATIRVRFAVDDGGERIHEAGTTAARAAGAVVTGHAINQHGGFELLRQVKYALDPRHVMNPGKLGL